MSLKDRAFEFLRLAPDARFSARQIANWIHSNYPAETGEKLRRSSALRTEADLVQQLVAEIGANRPQWQNKHPQLRTTETRPRLYYWTEKTEPQEIEEAERGTRSSSIAQTDLGSRDTFLERDLYEPLIAFSHSEFSARAVRIDEGTASNRRGPGGNKWLYPDVVALEALTAGFNKEVLDAIRESGDRRARLWSFEVKRLLNRSNVREAYFQAVSNSSWANFGYLVAAEIEGAATLKEIQMLYSVHGIGLIQLDYQNPAESFIQIPARERANVEWSMCSRLADENSDFAKFMKRVRQFYQTGDL
jgi:hypothetical protein